MQGWDPNELVLGFLGLINRTGSPQDDLRWLADGALVLQFDPHPLPPRPQLKDTQVKKLHGAILLAVMEIYSCGKHFILCN